jgi:glycosyltransferase involved in cell wall biosynthesis
MKISFAVTHYNRFDMLRECVDAILYDERIGEVVISDDASDPEVRRKVEKFSLQDPKIKVFSNETNKDCYANKRIAVELCTNPWVILADSDNIFHSDYIDQLYKLVPWDSKTIYAPDFAMPHFDYRRYSGLLINRKFVSGFVDMKMADTALNTANYFVNREWYLKVWDGSVNPHTADTIFHNYNHLAAGGDIFVVPGMQYEHRVHDGSHYKTRNHLTGNFYNEVIEKLKALK